MDASQWTQDIEVFENSRPLGIEKKLQRPGKDEVLNCPRCNSINTKFCYYNNYSLSQPRYLCKTCRRYWTNGGSLRNVPVGGGSRKNRSSSSKKAAQSHSPPKVSPQNPNFQQGQTLNLAFNGVSRYVGLPLFFNDNNIPQNPSSSQSGGLASSFVNDPMPMGDDQNTIIYSSGLVLTQEFNPCLNFGSDWIENRFGNLQEVVQDGDHTSSSKDVLSFEGLKANEEILLDQEKYQNGYIWNGMLDGRGPW